jgi:ribosomal protein S18 acetylase RimI-like enzyme
MTPEVTPATASDRAPIAETLKEAFVDDPLAIWMLPDERSRPGRMLRQFDVELRVVYLPLGTVWTTSDNRGAAVWRPPGRIPTMTVLRAIPEELRALGLKALGSSFTVARVMPRFPKQPYWYLHGLGVRTADQGKGIGSALLRPVLDRCDDSGLPAYLITATQPNIAFYSRHGFEVTNETQVPHSGPRIWTMWRDPRNGPE